MDIEEILKVLKLNTDGLIPAIAQDIKTKKVLMLAYMNKESIEKTFETGVVHYYSRSRNALWKKGETSGNIQRLIDIYYDCDNDSLLIMVEQIGVACHTGAYSCFFNGIFEARKSKGEKLEIINEEKDIMEELYSLLVDRQEKPIENSYSCYLYKEGLDKILKKVGEEASEVIIAAKNKDKGQLVYEISDLIYHLLILMINENITIDDIKDELKKRRKKRG